MKTPILASASLMSSCSNSPNARTGTVIGALGGNLIGGAQDRNRYDDRYYNGNRRRH